MKVVITKDGKSVEAEIPDEQFEKLFVEEKNTGYEKVGKGKQYLYVDSFGNVSPDVAGWTLNWDNKRYKNANYFSDKKVAENMARAQRLWNRIHRRTVELCEPVSTLKEGLVYTIYYVKSENQIRATSEYGRCFGAIYFDTREHCRQVINEFRDELLWYFTEFKDRADM